MKTRLVLSKLSTEIVVFVEMYDYFVEWPEWFHHWYSFYTTNASKRIHSPNATYTLKFLASLLHTMSFRSYKL